jgi:hypothetical protein
MVTGNASRKRRKKGDDHVDLLVDPTQLIVTTITTDDTQVPNAANIQHMTKDIFPLNAQSNGALQTHSLPPTVITVNNSSAVVSHQTTLTVPGINIDMSLTQISDPNFRHIISQCIKRTVFRRCKFYNREHHGAYNENVKTFSGMVLNHCHIVANEVWWFNTRKLIVTIHTNHRNNCIKAMNTKFKGKQQDHHANPPL